MKRDQIYKEPISDNKRQPELSSNDFLYQAVEYEKTEDTPTILFFSADSKEHINKCVSQNSSVWSRNHPLCNRPIGCAEAYRTGGQYAASLALDVAEEAHAIQDSCDRKCNAAKFIPFLNVRKSEFKKRLESTRFNILHYAGHCNKKFGLSLISVGVPCVEMKDTHVTEDELVASIRGLNRKIDVAFIASCNSERFAQALIEHNLASVAIGTRNTVKDHSILTFVTKFYDSFFEGGYPVGRDLVRKAQEAYGFAQSCVLEKDCEVCLFPSPLRPKVHNIRNYEDVDSLILAESEEDALNKFE